MLLLLFYRRQSTRHCAATRRRRDCDWRRSSNTWLSIRQQLNKWISLLVQTGRNQQPNIHPEPLSSGRRKHSRRLQRQIFIHTEFHLMSSEDPEAAAVWLCCVLLCSAAHSDRKLHNSVQKPVEQRQYSSPSTRGSHSLLLSQPLTPKQFSAELQQTPQIWVKASNTVCLHPPITQQPHRKQRKRSSEMTSLVEKDDWNKVH